MRRVRTVYKALVPLVGLGVTLIGQRWGVDSPAFHDLLWLLGAAGVWTVPYHPKETSP